MKVTSHRRGHLAVTVALTCLSALLLTACSSVTKSAQLESYKLGPGPQQVTIRYVVGNGDPAGTAEVVKQTASDVTVKVSYRHKDGQNTAIAIPKEIVVDLAAPLGSRTVRDNSGAALPLTRAIG